MRLIVMLAAACTSSPSLRAPAAMSGRAKRVPIGAFEAYALEDGHLVVPNDGQLLGFGRSPGEIAEVVAAAGLPRDTIRLDIQCLLVEAGERVILFDTGTGGSLPDTGHLPLSLALVHVAPAAVTDIFISHAHSDHVGGLVTRAGALAFPAATIHISAPEWAALQADPDADSKHLVVAITAKVVTFEPGAQVLPIVKAVATPGHTPGHSSYEIGAAPDTMVYLGDVAHHSVISVQHPEWSFGVDLDHPAADATRRGSLASLATGHTRVFAPHFPFPGIGRVVVEGRGLVWQPETR